MGKYKTQEVFGISRDVPLNYVERIQVDNVLKDSLAQKNI